MNVGAMRHRVTVLAPVETRNDHGDSILEYTPESVRWAEVRHASGREVYTVRPGVGREFSEATHHITMRHYDGLTPRHRIRYNDRDFEIWSVVEDTFRHEMIVVCKELL